MVEINVADAAVLAKRIAYLKSVIDDKTLLDSAIKVLKDPEYKAMETAYMQLVAYASKEGNQTAGEGVSLQEHVIYQKIQQLVPDAKSIKDIFDAVSSSHLESHGKEVERIALIERKISDPLLLKDLKTTLADKEYAEMEKSYLALVEYSEKPGNEFAAEGVNLQEQVLYKRLTELLPNRQSVKEVFDALIKLRPENSQEELPKEASIQTAFPVSGITFSAAQKTQIGIV